MKRQGYKPMPTVIIQGNIVYYNPATDDLAMEESGQNLIALQPEDEKQIRDKFAFQLKQMKDLEG